MDESNSLILKGLFGFLVGDLEAEKEIKVFAKRVIFCFFFVNFGL